MKHNDPLREKAEAILRNKKDLDVGVYTKSLEEVVEELRIYHIELEHQNAELLRVTQEKERLAKRAKKLYNLAPAGYLTINGDRKILEANKTFVDFIQQDRSQVIGSPLSGYIHEDSQDAFYFYLRDLEKSPDQQLSAFLFLSPYSISGDRETRECRLEGVCRKEDNGKGWVIDISLFDETAERKLKRQVQKEKEIWKQSFSFVQDAIILVGPDFRITEVNRSAEKLLQRPSQEILGDYYYNVIHGKEKTDQCPSCQAIQNREVCHHEIYEEHLGLYLDIGITPVFVHKKFQFYTIVIRDISDKKNQEIQLMESEKRFRTIFDQNVAAMCITNEFGYFEMVNEAYTRLYQYSEEELLGRHFTMVVPQANREFLSKAHDDFIQNKGEIRGEWEVVDREGKIHNILADAAHIEGNDGRPKKVTFVVDISDLKKAMKELRNLNATKDKFFSIVAHDLKSPLSTILNFSQLIKSKDMDFSDEEKERFLNFIHEGARNINRLLDNLLVWSRAQRGHLHFQPRLIEIQTLVENSLNLLEQNAHFKRIALVPEFLEDIEAKVDGNMIDTVIRNLINNAIKFTPQGGQVLIRVEKGTPQVRVSVIDNGVGMNQEKLEQLFNIKTNASTRGTDKEPGSGLGLLICKEFIDRHKGRIWAESQEGKGSRFIFEI